MRQSKLKMSYFKPKPAPEPEVTVTNWDVDNAAQEITDLLKRKGYQQECMNDIARVVRGNFQTVFASRNLIKKQTTTTFQVFDKVHAHFGNTIDRGFVNTITRNLCEQNYYFLDAADEDYVQLPMEVLE